MDLPINVPDLEKAVETAGTGISYKFYKAVFKWVRPTMAHSLNAMLEEGQLSRSLWQGSLGCPPGQGTLLAGQLRPITHINTHYKLLTEVFVKRPMGVLLSVLQKAQLCSVRGKNIMQGPFFSGPH
jgi:hypothetical protein